ncbi:MAG: flavin reductase family protein [Theionarchaea archaeon]|nr:flavin reductase family protein [Theionarchaea archaeon]MBU7038811.1 flavin reductase family protein [Theionarchaea archaeon]
MKKISLQIKDQHGHTERYLWKQCVFTRQVVLISTVNADGTATVAPKTWATPCGRDPPLFMFCCTDTHMTSQNVRSTKEFVVNYPGINLVEKVAITGGSHSPDKLEAAGLTLIPSEKVSPPRIAECYLHLECVLEEARQSGLSDYLFIGKVVAASSDLLPDDVDKRIETVAPLIYVSGKYAGICHVSDWKWPVAR